MLDDFILNFSYEEWEDKYLTLDEISDIIYTETEKENGNGRY